MLMRNKSGEYAFLPKRLCARRILCFLKRHGLERAAHQLEKETTVFFDVNHLTFLATCARWDELASYVDLFVRSNEPEPPSREALKFSYFLHIFRVLAMIAAGHSQAEAVDKLYPVLDEAEAKANNSRKGALPAFFHKVRQNPPRGPSTWMAIWAGAAKRLKDLALKCPELKGKLHLPHYAPKRWQINLSGVRPVLRPLTKKVKKQKARDIACFFKEKRQEITRSPSGFSSNATSDPMLSDLQVGLAVLQDTTDAPGVRGDEMHGSEAEDASKLKKRKISAEMLEITDADVGTRKTRKLSSPL